MKLIFAGTPEFASIALQQLISAGHEIVLVLTQPDRPAGRGLSLQASAVKTKALEHGIAVAQPVSLKLDGKYPDEAHLGQKAIQDALQNGAQLMVVAAYGLILPQWALDAPALGCINIHASLLPRWRGAAPIHRAIQKGDTHTGVTIMQMNIGLDTGDMLLHDSLAIEPQDTTLSLHNKLADMGGRLCIDAINGLEHKNLTAQVQPTEGVCYAEKISKSESALQWSQSALELSRLIRALNPAPGANCIIGSDNYKVWMAQPDPNFPVSKTTTPEGMVLQANEGGIWIQTGEGVLHISELQRSGSKRMPIADLLRGKPIAVGTVCQKASL